MSYSFRKPYHNLKLSVPEFFSAAVRPSWATGDYPESEFEKPYLDMSYPEMQLQISIPDWPDWEPHEIETPDWPKWDWPNWTPPPWPEWPDWEPLPWPNWPDYPQGDLPELLDPLDPWPKYTWPELRSIDWPSAPGYDPINQPGLNWPEIEPLPTLGDGGSGDSCSHCMIDCQPASTCNDRIICRVASQCTPQAYHGAGHVLNTPGATWLLSNPTDQIWYYAVPEQCGNEEVGWSVEGNFTDSWIESPGSFNELQIVLDKTVAEALVRVKFCDRLCNVCTFEQKLACVDEDDECLGLDPLEFNVPSDFDDLVVAPAGYLDMTVMGGLGPYDWSLSSGGNWSLDFETTEDGSNTLRLDDTGDPCDYPGTTVTVTDACGNRAVFGNYQDAGVRNSSGGGWTEPAESLNIITEITTQGSAPYDECAVLSCEEDSVAVGDTYYSSGLFARVAIKSIVAVPTINYRVNSTPDCQGNCMVTGLVRLYWIINTSYGQKKITYPNYGVTLRQCTDAKGQCPQAFSFYVWTQNWAAC